MNRRTRVPVGVARRLPRPDPPSASSPAPGAGRAAPPLPLVVNLHGGFVFGRTGADRFCGYLPATADVARSGVEVRTVLYPEAVHGFLAIPLVEGAAAQALDEVVAHVRGRLAPHPAAGSWRNPATAARALAECWVPGCSSTRRSFRRRTRVADLDGGTP